MIKLSEYKNCIRQFKKNDMDYHHYYKYILLNNNHSWNFCNPEKCKPSFNDVYNNLKFLVLKRLIKKEGYKLKFYKEYHLVNIYKKCYELYKS